MSKTVALLLFGLVAAVVALAPVHNLDAINAIPNKYLVILAENSTEAIRDFHTARLAARLNARAQGEKVLSSFKIGTLIGYAAYYEKDMLEEERANPLVIYIENDQVVTINDVEPEADTITQSPATWGIDRIDQRNLPLSNSFTYYASAGAGVYSYIIDTGIQEKHVDFGGRAIWGFNSIANEGFTDGNGHGTHVASTTGGTTWGVAKKTTLIAVKALSASGSGSWEGVIRCIEWVTNDHTKRSSGGRAKSVANMSLGGGISSTVDNAVAQSISSGVNYAIAAGNNNQDACSFSPARVPTCISTVASARTDARASFSNFGTCTKIVAPGQDITAAWIGTSNSATNTISGTSMAAPHVCGAVALYLGHIAAAPLPAAVLTAITSAATPNVITVPGTGTPNRLLFASTA